MKHVRTTRAFTLIELITVIAITAILLTIIAVPVIQSFNLTRAAQGFANAQAKARELVAQIESEIEGSAGVRDNTGLKGSVVVPVPGADGTEVLVTLPYSKLDILKVAAGDPASRVGSAYIDPNTGKADPTLKAPKGQPQFPSVPGETIVRYFVGLRNPEGSYFNPYVPYLNPAGDRWMGVAGGRDNLFVLFKAEVPVYVFEDHDGNPGTPPQRVVNTDFFIDLDRADADPETTGPLLDDPTFFVWDDGAPGAIYSAPRAYDPANRNEMVRNWLAASTVVTELTRFDMVMPKYHPNTFQMQFIGNAPALVSLIRFQPTRVAQETAAASLAVSSGEETENAVNLGADVFATQYPNWGGLNFQIWPSTGPGGAGPLANSAGRPVGTDLVSTIPLESLTNAAGDGSLFYAGNEVFNWSSYLRRKRSGAAYPFSASVVGANVTGAAARDFIPMVPDAQTGKIQASFPIQEFGSDAGVAYDNRVPSTGADPGVDVGPTVTPADAGYQSGSWNNFSTINERFALQYNLWDSLFPGGASSAPDKAGEFGPKRFIDLRLTPQFGPSATNGPLHPSLGLVRAQIVPGSMEVYGPDQRPGPNYGNLVRYSEVPNTGSISVGANQFKANYTHKANEPDWNDLFGFTVPANGYQPDFYDAGSFLSSMLQARYRAGYIELNSNFGEPIPPGNIFVVYRFQFTDSKTIVAVDYDSGELMEVVLTIRNYPQTNIPNPQMVTVRGTAAVKNALR